jgi:hypothetical protein
MSRERHGGRAAKPTGGRSDAAPAAGLPDSGGAAALQGAVSFVVEVVLDQAAVVRRTSVLHVAADEQESWAGWDPQRVVVFMTQRLGPPAPTPVVPGAVAGEFPRLRDLEATATATGGLAPLLEGGAFAVEATLEQGPAGSVGPTTYVAVVHAKQLGGRERRRLGELRGRLAGEHRARLKVPAVAPPRGFYRLEMGVTVGAEGQRGAEAVLRGGLLLVR